MVSLNISFRNTSGNSGREENAGWAVEIVSDDVEQRGSRRLVPAAIRPQVTVDFLA